jgi:hypothetical protein
MKNLSNLSTRQILILLFILALLLSLLSFLENPGGWTPEWRSNWLANLSSEILGAVITFLLFDRIIARRSEKERLIREMGSTDNATALKAVRELNVHGWLVDGSLRGVSLWKADLQSAVLDCVVFDGSKLPNGLSWKADTDLRCFTNPNHPNFWRCDYPGSPAYRAPSD